MEQKNEKENSKYSARLKMLEELKLAVLETTSRIDNDQPEFKNTYEKIFEDESDSSLGSGKSFSKSTSVGRAMSEQERGYTSAIMLGIMTFVIEVSFLAITYFIFR